MDVNAAVQINSSETIPVYVLLVFPLRLIEVLHHPVVKVVTAMVRAARHCHGTKDSEDILRWRNIKRPAINVIGLDVLLALQLPVDAAQPQPEYGR